jgi:DNA-binding transcriptional ArsR family regulator
LSTPQAPEDETQQFWSLVEAMGNPIRCKVLTALANSREDVSVRQISERIGEPMRKVRYHLDLLVDRELAAVTGVGRRRGVKEHRFRAQRAPVISVEQSALLDEEQSKRIARQVLVHILGDIRTAVAAKTFGTRRGHTEARVAGLVDRRGWEDLAEIHERAIAAVQAAVERGQARLGESADTPISFASGFLLFEAAPSPQPEP